MPRIRIKDAAVLLGVSDDTVRRWIDGGSLASFKDESGRKVISRGCAGQIRPGSCGAAARSPRRRQFRAQPIRRPSHEGDDRSGDGRSPDAVRALHRRLADEQ